MFVFCSSSSAIQFEVWDPSVGYIPFTAPAHSLLTLAWNTHWPLICVLIHFFVPYSHRKQFIVGTHPDDECLDQSSYDFNYYILSEVISLVTYIKFNWLISSCIIKCFLHWLFCWELALIMKVMNSLRRNITGFKPNIHLKCPLYIASLNMLC